MLKPKLKLDLKLNKLCVFKLLKLNESRDKILTLILIIFIDIF